MADARGGGLDGQADSRSGPSHLTLIGSKSGPDLAEIPSEKRTCGFSGAMSGPEILRGGLAGDRGSCVECGRFAGDRWRCYGCKRPLHSGCGPAHFAKGPNGTNCPGLCEVAGCLGGAEHVAPHTFRVVVDELAAQRALVRPLFERVALELDATAELLRGLADVLTAGLALWPADEDENGGGQ